MMKKLVIYSTLMLLALAVPAAMMSAGSTACAQAVAPADQPQKDTKTPPPPPPPGVSPAEPGVMPPSADTWRCPRCGAEYPCNQKKQKGRFDRPMLAPGQRGMAAPGEKIQMRAMRHRDRSMRAYRASRDLKRQGRAGMHMQKMQGTKGRGMAGMQSMECRGTCQMHGMQGKGMRGMNAMECRGNCPMPGMKGDGMRGMECPENCPMPGMHNHMMRGIEGMRGMKGMDGMCCDKMRGMQGKAGRSEGNAAMRLSHHAADLELTEDQVAKLDELAYTTKMKIIDMHATVEKERLEVKRLLESDNANLDAISQHLHAIAETRADIQAARIANMLEAKRLLTDEQKKMIEERFPRMKRALD
jgi:hypothetical protein